MAETSAADRAGQILDRLTKLGARRVEPGYLQPADLLLDLYGENIRARAYLTSDPALGEQMLRPDFTVPLVRAHIAQNHDRARYAYAGPVWRRQEYGSELANEFWQAGYEMIGFEDRAAADAEVFATVAQELDGQPVTPVTGDLALLLAAIETLRTSAARKHALRRHLWRPDRFARLLARFGGATPFDCDTRDFATSNAEAIGLRSRQEITDRLERLKSERDASPISTEEVAMIETIINLRGSATACAQGFEALARSFPDLADSLAALIARLDALSTRGIDVDALPFDGAFGRGTMEYYNGFTFAFLSPSQEPIAQGGRYDALTAVLGDGRAIPAVGGVIKPGSLL